MKKHVAILSFVLLLLFVSISFAADLSEDEKDLCQFVLEQYPEELQPMMEVEINSYRAGKEVYLYVKLNEIALGTQAKNIAIVAVQGALEWLMAKGHDPAKEWISVNCRPYAREKGATGKDLRRVWGKADYDWNTDQIKWVPAN